MARLIAPDTGVQFRGSPSMGWGRRSEVHMLDQNRFLAEKGTRRTICGFIVWTGDKADKDEIRQRFVPLSEVDSKNICRICAGACRVEG